MRNVKPKQAWFKIKYYARLQALIARRVYQMDIVSPYLTHQQVKLGATVLNVAKKPKYSKNAYETCLKCENVDL